MLANEQNQTTERTLYGEKSEMSYMRYFRGMSVDDNGEALEQAVSDPNVSSKVLEVDSPSGQVAVSPILPILFAPHPKPSRCPRRSPTVG